VSPAAVEADAPARVTLALGGASLAAAEVARDALLCRSRIGAAGNWSAPAPAEWLGSGLVVCAAPAAPATARRLALALSLNGGADWSEAADVAIVPESLVLRAFPLAGSA
jgi:hypothetical protein